MIFEQKMFYYKFNLIYKEFLCKETKAIKKKNLSLLNGLEILKVKNIPNGDWIFFQKEIFKH